MEPQVLTVPTEVTVIYGGFTATVPGEVWEKAVAYIANMTPDDRLGALLTLDHNLMPRVRQVMRGRGPSPEVQQLMLDVVFWKALVARAGV